MQDPLGLHKSYELLNLGLYSRRLRLQQPKMSKTDFSPPPRGGVFGPNLGVFDPPPGGGKKVTFFRNFVKFREISGKFVPENPEKPPPSSSWGGVFFTFFHFFSKISEISGNFGKFGEFPSRDPQFPNLEQKCTPTGRRGGGGAMRSIAGVNLRTCSGEHMYRVRDK